MNLAIVDSGKTEETFVPEKIRKTYGGEVFIAQGGQTHE